MGGTYHGAYVVRPSPNGAIQYGRAELILQAFEEGETETTASLALPGSPAPLIDDLQVLSGSGSIGHRADDDNSAVVSGNFAGPDGTEAVGSIVGARPEYFYGAFGVVLVPDVSAGTGSVVLDTPRASRQHGGEPTNVHSLTAFPGTGEKVAGLGYRYAPGRSSGAHVTVSREWEVPAGVVVHDWVKDRSRLEIGLGYDKPLSDRWAFDSEVAGGHLVRHAVTHHGDRVEEQGYYMRIGAGLSYAHDAARTRLGVSVPNRIQRLEGTGQGERWVLVPVLDEGEPRIERRVVPMSAAQTWTPESVELRFDLEHTRSLWNDASLEAAVGYRHNAGHQSGARDVVGRVAVKIPF